MDSIYSTTVASAPTIAPPCQKKKLVFVMGSTGSGKSRLSIDIASHYLGEVINSDKMQVYKGLDIITNKMAESDRRGVPHHLIGEVEPDVDFTAEDFCMAATSAIERIVEQGRVPIIVGGSNSFVEALVQNPSVEFKSRYEPCFIWLNVAPPILDTYLSKRVDDMVRGGLVEEVKAVFSPNLDYKRGIYRSIGVPEMDAYLRADRMVGYIERETLLKEAIDDIKANTCKLASKQVGKIETLRNKLGWNMHQIDTTPVFEKCGEEADAAWEMLVKKPTFGIIDSFLTWNPTVTCCPLDAFLAFLTEKRVFFVKRGWVRLICPVP